jgi:hypothetical protein
VNVSGERRVKRIEYLFILLPAIILFASCQIPPKDHPELILEVVVEGLLAGDKADIQLMPDTQETVRKLQDSSISLPTKTVSNGEYTIEIHTIPAGAYKIVIDAPTSYYHEPRGYIFRHENHQIVRKQDNRFSFRLVSPSQQSLPPCREEIDESSAVIGTEPVENEQGTVVPEEKNILCKTEKMIDVSAPPKKREQP